MSPERQAIIIGAVRSFPSGATAKEVAAALSWRDVVTSCALGRLYLAGVLKRWCADPDRRRNEYVYSIATGTVVQTFRPWAGAVRIPARLSEIEIERAARIGRLAAEAEALIEFV